MARNFLNPSTWLSPNEDTPNGGKSNDIDVDKYIRKASLIDKVGDTRERKLDKLAVSTLQPEWKSSSHDKDSNVGIFGMWQDSNFRNYIQFSLNNDKNTRIYDYKELAREEKLEACIHEISTSCLASHDNQESIVGKLEGDYSDNIKSIVTKEITKVVNFFQFDKRGQDVFRDFLITGEVAFENIFSVEKPELGIIGVKSVPVENIEPIYRNFHNQEVEAFVLKKPNQIDRGGLNRHMERMNSTALTYETIPMARSQVTYCNSGEWDCHNRYVVPYIMKGQNAQQKLTLIEDSIVINAIVNAPERLLWNIPVGNMDGPKKEQYMQSLIREHKKKKGVDNNGNISEKYDPISITEDLYIPQDNDGRGATVTRLAGSSAFGNGFGGMLDYFHQKVYEDMHVPVTRLNPDVNSSDGSTITMQELAFAERIIAIQKKLACAIKDTVIAHLKLKGLKLHNESCENQVLLENKRDGVSDVDASIIDINRKLDTHIKLVEEGYHCQILEPALRKSGKSENSILHELGKSYWDQYELNEFDINIKFSLPTSFLALREQQAFDLKWNNFNNMAGSGFFSPLLLAKEELGWSDEKILRHIEWRKKEAAKNWEISQIEEGGPDFRANAAEEAGVESGGITGGLGGGGGGSALPSIGGGGGGSTSTGGGDDVPDFGGEGGLDDLDGDTPDSGSPDSGGDLDDLPDDSGGDSPPPTPDTPEPDESGDDEEV